MTNTEQPQLETEHFPEKLMTAVASDFPMVREVLVAFPDEWELVRTLRQQDQPLYAAAFPWEQAPKGFPPRRDRFYGLSSESNLSMNKYRHVIVDRLLSGDCV